MPTLTDYLESTIGGSAAVAVVKSTWVQLTNNSTAVTYVSTAATDSAGKFTVNNLPAGSYSVATGPSATGPWTATGDTNYLVAPTAADNTSTFPGAVTVPSLTVSGALALTAGPVTGAAGIIPLSVVNGAAADNAVVHLAGAETITGAKRFNAAPVVSVDATLIGSGGDPNTGAHTVGLTATSTFTSPNQPITQAFIAFGYYAGTPGASQGTLQGGSSEVYLYTTGAVMTGAGLGFEGLARTVGTGTSTPTLIGLQGNCSAQDTTTVSDLISINAAGPANLGGTPTVTRAKSLNVVEPTVGTTRYSVFVTGPSRFEQGLTAADTVAVANAAHVRSWAFGQNPQILTGYASDGATSAITFDATDTAAKRVSIGTQTASMIGLYINSPIGVPTADYLQIQHQGGPVFSINASGTAVISSSPGINFNYAATAAGTGAAPTLPANTPTGATGGALKYIAVQINGATAYLLAAQ